MDIFSLKKIGSMEIINNIATVDLDAKKKEQRR